MVMQQLWSTISYRIYSEYLIFILKISLDSLLQKNCPDDGMQKSRNILTMMTLKVFEAVMPRVVRVGKKIFTLKTFSPNIYMNEELPIFGRMLRSKKSDYTYFKSCSLFIGI